MKASQRAASIAPSVTFAIEARVRELREQGLDVIGLGVGQPDFAGPPQAAEAVIAGLAESEGRVGYTAASGTLELREAAAAHVSRVSGCTYSAQDLIVTNGAKEALALALAAAGDPGDTLLLPSVNWLSYAAMAQAYDLKPHDVPVNAENHFKLRAAALDAAAAQTGARLLLLNSPNNPTGAVFSEAELLDIAAVCVARDITVISDEIYWPFVFDGRFVSIASLPGMAERTFVVNGLSKSHAMTGWRVGFLAGHGPALKAAASLKSHLSSNASVAAQWAAQGALASGPEHTANIASAFARRRDLALELLAEIPGLQVDPPQGAFYVFPRVDALYGGEIQGSVAFCQRLLEEQRLAAVPGAAFGENRCIRLSIAVDDATLEQGLARLAAFATALSEARV
ncbi:MAG: aminotransferase [Planctomycetota bacterium]|nr:MAG: aminotransferase [Planctomycetota bacterium]